jgi:hypothetical protein
LCDIQLFAYVMFMSSLCYVTYKCAIIMYTFEHFFIHLKINTAVSFFSIITAFESLHFVSVMGSSKLRVVGRLLFVVTLVFEPLFKSSLKVTKLLFLKVVTNSK